MVMQFDGRSVDVKSALAYSRGGSAIYLRVSSQPHQCSDIAPRPGSGGKYGRSEEDLWFDAMITPQLKADGSTSWQVGYTYFRGTSGDFLSVPATVTAQDVSTDGTVKASFEAIIPKPLPGLPAKFKKKPVTVSGLVTATGCGRIEFEEVPARPQNAVVVKVAGQRTEIQSASLREGAHGPELVLSSQPRAACDKMHRYGIDFELIIGLDGSPPKVTRLGLRGNRILMNPWAQYRTDKPGLDFTANGAILQNSEPIELTLNGTADLMGYPVSVEGQVSAQQCMGK